MNPRLALLLSFFCCGFATAQSPCLEKIGRSAGSLVERGCECGPNLSRHSGLKVPGFRLVAACFHEAYPKSALQGIFYYRGAQEFEGEIFPNEIDSGMVFSKGRTVFYLYETNVSISHLEEMAAHGPACRSAPRAPAKLRIELFERVTGDGGQAGDFPLQYKLLSIGKFSCPAEDRINK